MRVEPHDGISALIRRGQDQSTLSLPYENIARMWLSASQEEGPRQTKSASILILDFPASKIMRGKCLLFKLPSVWQFVMEAYN